MSKKSPNPNWRKCSRFLSSPRVFFCFLVLFPPMYFYSLRHLKFHKSPREKTDGLWLWLCMHLQKNLHWLLFQKGKAKISPNSRQEPERERRDELKRQSYGSRLIHGITLDVRREEKTIWLSRDYSLMQSSILLVLLIHYVLLCDLTIRRLDQVYKSPIKSDYSGVEHIPFFSGCFLCGVLHKKEVYQDFISSVNLWKWTMIAGTCPAFSVTTRDCTVHAQAIRIM